MPAQLNDTHDPARRSWVASANVPDHAFPLQNLPLGMFVAADGAPRPCTAIGDQLLDIRAARDLRLLTGTAADAATLACSGGSLNALIAAGHPAASALRAGLSALLDSGADAARAEATSLLHPLSGTDMAMPVAIGGFTDFMCSLPHSERMGRMLRPANPLPPAFKYLPIAYNSRASSVRISGTPLIRPAVQRANPDPDASMRQAALFGPCTALDYEMELGAFLIGGNPLGTPLSLGDAAQTIFGYTLLNDWSARDIQRWEGFPLGPFLGKSLLTTISPWIVTAQAMAPFHAPPPARPPEDPALLAYLDGPDNRAHGALRIQMRAALLTRQADARGLAPHPLALCDFSQLYWTLPQMVAHHASNGCNLLAGDLIGSGTVSDATPTGRACLAEMTPDFPIGLASGEQRRFLEDHDTLILSARAVAPGAVPIGFGPCIGTVLPARWQP